jgi:hypothetical protein
MKYTKIMVSQKIQLKQFEPIEVVVEAQLEDNDNLQECINEVKRQVAYAIALKMTITGTPEKAGVKGVLIPSEKTIPGVTDVYEPKELKKAQSKQAQGQPDPAEDDNF